MRFFGRGVYPELYEILRGACPERDSSVASLPQNDKKRRAQNGSGEGLPQNDRERKGQSDDGGN